MTGRKTSRSSTAMPTWWSRGRYGSSTSIPSTGRWQTRLWREDGKTSAYLKINGEICRDTTNINLPRHALWRPGMTWESVGELDPDVRHAMNEGAWEPQARLRDMDAMGVDQALLYPTWFAEGFHLVHDPDVAYALARAYNDWIADFCQAAPERLFAVAMVPLQNMDFAVEELQRVADIPCFRAAFIRPMFVENRYFTHPYYDPLWAELERLGLTAAVHPTPGLWNRSGRRTVRFLKRCVRGCTSPRAFPAAADRFRAAAMGYTEPAFLPPPRPSAIRWRRFYPAGWITTCSSPRC